MLCGDIVNKTEDGEPAWKDLKEKDQQPVKGRYRGEQVKRSRRLNPESEGED